MTHPEIPGPIAGQLGARFGEPCAVGRLGGLSGAPVLRLQFPTSSAILKVNASTVERHVYQRLSGLFEAHGVRIPRLLAAGDDGGTPWLLIEDVPEPLPDTNRLADRQLLGILRRLHCIALDPALLPKDRYRPRWDAEMTDAALSFFPTETRAELRERLARHRERVQPLFGEDRLLSGDPNPRNWAVRPSGELVLFDWERLTLGSPILDVAITVPGLGSRADFERTALAYWGALPAAELTARVDDLVSAKAWTVVEFLAELARRQGAVPPELAGLLEVVPEWLRLGRGTRD